ncbi:ABC transporter permease [Thermococcus gammatolerans]|uniref:Two-domain ABC-type transport system permease protein, putative sulfate/molybdate/tungstate transporter (ModB) n=1 Tax=Thermococcus gammatolerans (strain DSM 15229 / JCM 11827 / EJ3) TaxID=593117 RepID=C5A5S7_THEGJ|nr:iron ABC transporter permease [Thermococcus gammatolerans]ACS33589.1 Two-domain ABC-type transport system permease protein, putative sulfate/molybdate/tungstate transporter (modB) [Thermococcus gammatolerans EJ3]
MSSKWIERLFGIPKPEPLVISSYLFPLLYLVFFLIIPVLAMLAIAFTYNGSVSLHWFREIFTWNSDYMKLPSSWHLIQSVKMPGTGETLYIIEGLDFGIILNSIIVAAIVTLLASIMGTIFAFVMARYEFPGKNVFRILLFIPLLVTPFVSAYVVQQLFSEYGLVSSILHALFNFRVRIDGLAGVTLAQAITYYPIVYLNAYASFINIDPSLEEQAENLGSRGFHLFRTVTFPLALPGIAAGATLVFIFSLEDLAAPIVFHSNNLAKKIISYQVFSKFLYGTGERSPLIAALAIVMLALAILAFLGIRKYVGLRQYAMLSKGGRWSPRVRKPRLGQALIIYLVLLPLLVFTITPQAGVVKLAFTQEQRVVTNVTDINAQIIGTIYPDFNVQLPENGVVETSKNGWFFQGKVHGYSNLIGEINGTLNGFIVGNVSIKDGTFTVDGKIIYADFQGKASKYNGTIHTQMLGPITGSGTVSAGMLNLNSSTFKATMFNIPAGKKTEITAKYVKKMILDPDVRRYIVNSLTYSAAAVVLIVLLAITSSYATSRFKGALTPVLESIVILPMAVPGIVVAMGYFYFFHQIFPGTPLDPIDPKHFNPAYVLILAYSIRRLPFAARSVYAGLQQVHVSLEEAAMNLGASRWKTITSIILPLISLNVFGGAMLSFVYSMSETSVGITLGSLKMANAPITAYMKEIMMSAVGSVNIAAALGVLLITVQIISIVLVNVITKQKYSFIGLS